MVWISRTEEGIQYVDMDRIKNKDKGIIEISTKFLKIDAYNSKKI